METSDFFRDKERNADAKRAAISDPANWPADEIEEPGQVSGVKGPLNATEDSMIAEIDRKRAEERGNIKEDKES